MKQKLYLALLICLAALFLTACAEEEPEILISDTITRDSLQFEIPKGFILKEDRSTETVFYYESELHEFSKVIYEKLDNDGSFENLTAETSVHAIKEYAKETYLAKTRPEVVFEERTEINGHPAYQYIIAYNLYDAPMTHSHCYIEDGEVIHHIEYIGVEEEGYDASFALYFNEIRMD
ncbi:MAG: hypothetical protein IJP31_10030 [Lachnospiraceae bacterium]|nr:hypothetical protein [Lachnospiraceae bacterium]